MILTRHRYLVAASIVAMGAGMGFELLEMGGRMGPFIACIGLGVALFLAWDMPRVVPPPNSHRQAAIEPLEIVDDSDWLSTFPVA